MTALGPPEPPAPPATETPPAREILLIPPPEKTTARAMRPLWRDLIRSVWDADPLQCPCCKGTLRRVESVARPEAVEFFLRLHGLWQALVSIPPAPDPPFDIETFEPVDPPWPAIREWIPADDSDFLIESEFLSPSQPRLPENQTPRARNPEPARHHSHRRPAEIRLDEDRVLILDPN